MFSDCEICNCEVIRVCSRRCYIYPVAYYLILYHCVHLCLSEVVLSSLRLTLPYFLKVLAQNIYWNFFIFNDDDDDDVLGKTEVIWRGLYQYSSDYSNLHPSLFLLEEHQTMMYSANFALCLYLTLSGHSSAKELCLKDLSLFKTIPPQFQLSSYRICIDKPISTLTFQPVFLTNLSNLSSVSSRGISLFCWFRFLFSARTPLLFYKWSCARCLILKYLTHFSFRNVPK